ncbi:11124_t:CDS:10 [Diversispora eburnea]|uniref:11124_t:CDS:1 n=1 Tax=Diversispora eburnea TaxID=1213867 RepID=A0A9N9A666_9GLOM|nr:11124_t:CDS:10 [Diversispora eburnea]
MQAHSEANNPDLGQSPNFMRTQRVITTGSSDVNSSTSSTTTPVTPLSQEQLNNLKLQILAFKLISRNMPLPLPLQTAMFSPNQVGQVSTQELINTSLPGKIIEASHNHHAYSHGSHTSNCSQADNSSSVQSQKSYNSYTNPLVFLKPINIYSHSSRQQRLMIPSITPVGLDPQDIADERERQLNAAAEQRVLEFKNILKLGGLSEEDRIKTKILYLANKHKHLQDKVRRAVVKGMSHANPATTGERATYRRMKKQSIRDARVTDKLEKQQRENRQRCQRQKHLDYLQKIVNHKADMNQWHRTNQNKQLKFGRAVLSYHSQVEKEEQKREERLRKERLRALKNDDEEAYLKLIDQEKDTRITHLLRQTDAYLESLAQAVVEQQHDDLHNDPSVRGGIELMDEDDEEEVTYTFVNGQKVEYYRVAHRIKEEVEQPKMLGGGVLKDYQVKGLQWMVSLYNNRLNGILADEMGLGKTIQTISLITYLVERKKQNGPFLIVVPLTLTNWTIEFDKWAPSIRKCVYKGSPGVRKELQQLFIKHIDFQVLLTTYEYIIKDKSILSKIRWVYVIIDEGHRMKNVNSKLSIILTNNYQCRYRLILTGTPLQNNLPELWSLLNFILPKIFDSVKSFDEWFNTPFANTGGQDKIALNEEESLLIIKRLHKVLRPFLLRRLKKDVESELPDKVETVIKCKLSSLQLKLYSQMNKHGVLFVNKGVKGKTGIKGLNNTIMQLRKICNHPFVFEEVENDLNGNGITRPINSPITTNPLIYRVSGKFELLDRILPKFYETNHRVLIFFQMTAIMSIMEDFMLWRGYKYLRLDGTTKADERSILLKQFNSENSDYFVFLLSTRAGGLGLNLQSADTVIIFDSDWNPHQDLQAQDRAHRIGQTREVRILRLISQRSIEEAILARAQYKLDIDGKVIQAGKFDLKSNAQEREEFLKEIEIFKQMDIERNKREEQEWRRSGGTGKRPSRLIEEYELPQVYRKEYDTIVQNSDSTIYGRGQRPRGSVHYDDGLTEEQWVNAIEDVEIDVDDLIAKKQAAKKRRLAKKSQKLTSQNPNETSQQSTPHPEEIRSDNESKKKRGRPRKDDVQNYDDNMAESSKSAKKKGKGKRVEIVEYDAETKIKKRKMTKKSQREEGPDTIPQTIREKQKSIFTTIYNHIENLTDESEGIPRQRSFLFLALPSKKDYNYYYKIIQKPIAMDMIRRKIKNNVYQTVTQFKDDWHLMFNNAKIFNEEGSQVYNDALKMQEEFDAKFEEYCPGGQLPVDDYEMEF